MEGVPECAFVVAVDSNRAMGEIGMSTFSMQDIPWQEGCKLLTCMESYSPDHSLWGWQLEAIHSTLSCLGSMSSKKGLLLGLEEK